MQSRNKFKRIVCIALAVIMTLSLVSTALILMVNAASSKEIEKELVDLRAQQAELKKQSDALKAEINQNEAETQTLIEKKADIDKQMDMSRQTIENLNAQIQQYSLLIADKQSELEDSLAEEAALNEQYKARLRTMEETGKISYWSILFGARSFSDLLDKIDMIQEIAKADQLMMEKLKAMGIGTGLHFRAAHTQKYYRERFPEVSLPNTEWNSARICSLPLFPDMTDDDVTRVISALRQLSGR